jgi:ribosomal protein S16
MRLQRRGKTGYATYRVVVTEQRAPIKGRSVADLGSYNPHTDVFAVDKERVAQWLGQGVQPTSTVHNLLVTHGLLKADKVTSWKPKKSQTETGASKPPQQDGAATTEKPAESDTSATSAAQEA